MMVTFVSQCEKKSLAKTRRVLDAFANRIGSNTWQTVITNEGLQAVKTLLRSTASKNTAVSCHWLRSRSRSELVWVVGNRSKFNAQGIVPVNYTTQENILKMDGVEVNIENYYANTKKQPLVQHLVAVGYLAYLLCKQLTDNEKLSKAAFVAGCWHDMGKIDPAFQQWIIDKTKRKLIDEIPEGGQHIDKRTGKFSFEKHPRHNEISLLLYALLDDVNDKSVSNGNKRLVKHCIYWHHAKPVRKEELKKLDGVYNKLTADEVNKIIPVTHRVIQHVDALTNSYGVDLKTGSYVKKANDDKLYDVKKEFLAEYKSYGENEHIGDFKRDVAVNAKNNIARTVIVTADRIVSALSAEALNTHIEQATLHQLLDDALIMERGLKSDIQTCLQGFEKRFPDSQRNHQQTKAVQELNDEDVSVGVLQGPAGCGKTKIALEWAASHGAKKIIWICPRVQVCQGLVNDLTSDEYLPNTKIELCTGEFKTLYQQGVETPTLENEEFSGDIVLTTIDQVINTITTHTKVTGLVQYMNSHVVFDEFHEYIPMAGFNLLFAELVACKNLQGKSNTLLVSATPNYYFVRELLGLDEDDLVSVDSFNQSKFKIEFHDFDEQLEDESNPLYQQQPNHTFVISNTALTAQKSFIKNQHAENAILIHSKFKQSDRKELFDQVYRSFKKGGDHRFDVLRAGPIVQASLNITCNKMITEFTNAENWLQRMGRLDRFGESPIPNIYISALTEHVKNGKCLGNARFLNGLFCLQSTKAWFEFLEDKLPENRTITIADVYKIYEEFYQHQGSLKAIEQDLVAALKDSVRLIELKIIDPISFPNKKKPQDGKVRIKNNSLRGNSRFVQVAVMNVDNGKEPFPNEYACEDESLTISVELITGYGESEINLLAFMAKKHHNIKSDSNYGVTKTSKYKDRAYLKKAKEPETPIYLSYTPEDLSHVGAEPHAHAIYYAMGVKQAIGAVSINHINKNGG